MSAQHLIAAEELDIDSLFLSLSFLRTLGGSK